MDKQAAAVDAGGGGGRPTDGGSEGELAIQAGARVECRDGHVGRVASVLRDSSTGCITRLVIRRGLLLGHDVVVPVEWAIKASRDCVYLDVGREELVHLPEYRADHDVKRDIEQALWDDETIRQADWPTLRVDVRDGVVTLRGHVASRVHRARAEAAARQARGVRELRNKLVADDDLEAAIAEALARDPRTQAHAIRVHAHRGIVHLSGAVISAEVQAAAEEATAEVEGVRGIVCRLLGTDAIKPAPSVILPAIGIRVFATDGLLGHLEQVVMNPRSRGITHLVVTVGRPAAARGESPEAATGQARLLVPVKLVDRWIEDAEQDAVEEAVLLRVHRAAAAAWLAEYREEHYAVPGPDWQPLFDYRREDVRFALDADVL